MIVLEIDRTSKDFLKLRRRDQGGRVGSSFEESDLEWKSEERRVSRQKQEREMGGGRKRFTFSFVTGSTKGETSWKPSQGVSSGGVGRKQGREREKWEILTL